MTHKEAVAKIESYGLKVPLFTLDFVKKVATVIEGLEQKVAKLKEEARVDGVMFNLGRSEGHADVAARLRRIFDPHDMEHLDLDAVIRRAGVIKAAHDALDHSDHGRGTAEDGPDDPDCPCRTTEKQKVCAASGCGFCICAEPKPVNAVVADLGFNLADLKDNDVVLLRDPDGDVDDAMLNTIAKRLKRESGRERLFVMLLGGKTDIQVLPVPDGAIVKLLDPNEEIPVLTTELVLRDLRKRFPNAKVVALFGKTDIEVEAPAPAVKFPHCDSKVLHAPGKCEFCDKYPEAQRMLDKINFTGESDPDKTPCPSTLRRPLETINQWPGNRPCPPEG